MPKQGSLLIKNTRVHTLNPAQPSAQTIVARNGRIVAVGDQALVAAYESGVERVLNADGAVVVPGFIDTHVHFTLTGLGLSALDLSGVDSIQTALDRLARHASAVPANHLIVASGFQPELNPEKRFPTPQELDRAAGGRPIYVMERGGHWSAVNDAAFALLDLPPDVEGLGDVPGVLTQSANMAAFTQLWARYKEQIGVVSAFERAAAKAAAGGVTTLHALDDLDDVRALLAIQDALPVRVVPYTQSKDVAAVKALGVRQIGGCGQVAVDGDFGPHTAALLEPYTDRPDTCGVLNYTDAELEAYVEAAHLAGLQVALHCVGSGAIEQLLNAYERVLARHPRPDHRHRLEHFELPAVGQAERARRLGVLLALQPSFNHFWHHDHEYPTVIGDERANRVDPVRNVLDAGVVPAFGSDSPVTPIRPLLWMHSAVNHSNPLERISAGDALRISTQRGAYFAFEEAEKGTIEAGKRADFAVLSDDPLTASPESLLDIRVLNTVVGGEIVWSAS